MKLSFIIFNILISICFTQVNTEAMRNDNKEAGINNNLSFDFSYFSGSSEIIQMMASYRLDYLTKSNWYGFISAFYNRAFEKDIEDFSNRGFIHLRLAKPVLINKIDLEGFLQKETNKFLNLKNRELIGGGLRLNQIDKLFIGLGVMHETEEYNNNSEIQKFLKSTNYINYQVNILKNINIQNVLYYQFKIENLQHYRLLWDGKLSLNVSDKISLHINTHYRYDNNGESYFEVSNGVGLQF